MDTYRGYEIKRGEGRRSRLWSWRVPGRGWHSTGWIDERDLMNYLAGRDDYGKESAEAGFGDGAGPDEERSNDGLPYVDGGKIYASVDRAEWLICERASDLPEDIWKEFVSAGVRLGMWHEPPTDI